MKRAGKHRELDPSVQAVEMNMTPMIDCTFLLLIFFMVVSEMSSLDMEDVSLPYADQSTHEDLPQGDMLTINIKQHDARAGIVRIGGKKYDKKKLEELILKEAIRAQYERDPEHPNIRPSKLWVFVRCDRNARYESVQWVFDACSKHRVYKTILAASPSSE